MGALAVYRELGSLMRSAAAVLFPSIVVLEDQQPQLGILLYLFETVLWSALLCLRSAVYLVRVRRADGGAVASRAISQLLLARELTGVTVVIGVVMLPMLGMGLFAVHGGAWQPQWEVLSERARWLAFTVLASVVLDTVAAPVRSPIWLQTAVAQQMTRLLVLHPVVMFGFVLYALTGSMLPMIAIFVALRLVVDASAWRRANRQTRRKRWFGGLADQEPQVARRGRVA